MAQDRDTNSKNGFLVMLENARSGMSSDPSGLKDWMENPFSGMYSDNHEMVRDNEIIGGVFDELTAKCAGKGFVFMLDDGKMCKPTPGFSSIFDTYYINFYVKAIRFYAVEGVLIMYKRKLENGLEVPEVVDRNQVSIDRNSGERSHANVIKCAWKDSQMQRGEQLYVLNEQLLSGSSRANKQAPIRRVLHQLFTLQLQTLCHQLSLLRSMKSEIMISDNTKVNVGTQLQSDTMALTVGQGVHLQNFAATKGNDANSQQRADEMRSLIDPSNVLMYGQSFPPAYRFMVEATKSIESRYHDLTPGFQAKEVVVPIDGSGFSASRKQLRAEIYAAFGLKDPTAGVGIDKASAPSSSSSSSSSSRNGSSGGSGGGGGGGGSDGYTDSTPSGSILEMWMGITRSIMTTTFRLMHHNQSIQIADVKPTYREQKRRVIPRGKTLQIDKILVVDVKSKHVEEGQESDKADEEEAAEKAKKRVSDESKPPAKKQKKSSDSDDEEEDGDSDDDDENDKKKKKKKEEKEDDGEEGEEKEYKTISASNTITVIPLSLILSHRDSAKSFMVQGGISEEAFFEMHPPVETDGKKEDMLKQEMEEEKRKMQDQIQKEKEKLNKEREKIMKEKMKEQGVVMKELQSRIDDLKKVQDDHHVKLLVAQHSTKK